MSTRAHARGRVPSGLKRLLALSARPVVAGGESGLWRWLIPALAIAVLALVGQRAAVAAHAADRAHAVAAEATALASDVVLDRDGPYLRHRAVAFAAAHPDDVDAADLARRLERGNDRLAALRASIAGARAVEDRYAGDASRAAGGARAASLMLIALALGLAVLLLWCVWARRSAARAAKQEQRFRSIVRNSSDLILVVGGRGNVIDCTPVVEKMLGRSVAGVVGSDFAALVHADDESPLTTPGPWRARHADGSWIDVESTCTDLRDDATVGGLVLVIRDVRERNAMEQRLHHAAFHDPLTGLANRALFEDRMRQAVARGRRTGAKLAVLFVDLDDFKTVNDSLGHAAGDELLRLTAARLDTCLRGADTAARLGGDEFALLLEDLEGAEGAVAVAQRVHDALALPFTIAEEEIFVQASVGIALHENGQLDEELMRNADMAMYAAKGAGKGRHELFRPVMHEAAQRRLQLTGDLRRAVRDNEFFVDYQPLIDLSDGTMLGAEALVRWEHPRLGRISPADFIPLAEETGLITQIGTFVLSEACHAARAWHDLQQSDRQAYVSVNLSPRQFRPPGRLVDEVKRITAEAGLDPSYLLLEITESVLLSDRENAAHDLTQLRALGVRVAIDDFGTGYSSLSYLRDFPIDIVKMDRSFVRDLGRGRADDALVRSVLELGQALDMQIVAEGIEEASQLDWLRDLQCGIGQGYYFSQPVSGERLAEIFKQPAPRS